MEARHALKRVRIVGPSLRGIGDPSVDGAPVLRLATLRSHNQYNTTIYGLDDRYRGVFGGRMVIFMNEIDMKARGIEPDALVEIESIASDGRRRVVRGFKVRPYAIPQGCIGLLPGNQSIVAVGPPRFEKQDSGGQIDPGFGQAALSRRVGRCRFTEND